jgi:hypothetical protein
MWALGIIKVEIATDRCARLTDAVVGFQIHLRSTGTSAVPKIAADFGAPRKSAEMGHKPTHAPQQKRRAWVGLFDHLAAAQQERLRDCESPAPWSF